MRSGGGGKLVFEHHDKLVHIGVVLQMFHHLNLKWMVVELTQQNKNNTMNVNTQISLAEKIIVMIT